MMLDARKCASLLYLSRRTFLGNSIPPHSAVWVPIPVNVRKRRNPLKFAPGAPGAPGRNGVAPGAYRWQIYSMVTMG